MPADLKRAMLEKARIGEKTFALTADVAEAHRQIPTHPTGLASSGESNTEVGGDVHINKVGTFGVASASDCWSRAATPLSRLTQYLTGRSAYTWHQLTEYRAALISFFVLCSTDGVPLSWDKTSGGDKSHVGRVRAPPQHVPPGNLGKASRIFIRWAEEIATVNSQLRRRAGTLDACGSGSRAREPLLSPF